MYLSSQSSFCFLSPAASLFCLHSIAANANSARPKGTPTATPTVAARSEVEGSEAAVLAAVVAIIVAEFAVVPASVTTLATVAGPSGDVEPDERFNITDP